MSNLTGYYSLIQFFPDPSRLEGVNIGVAVYSATQKKLHVRISQSNHRIRRFFGNQDWTFINRAKKAIANQLRNQQFASITDLEGYISKRANSIQLTPPRSMRVCDIEADLARLFDQLVGKESIDRSHRIGGSLKERLLDAGVTNLVKKSVNVQIPNLKRSIRVPYAYQNGRFNLITPVQFDHDTDVLAKTGKNAIEGQLLYDDRNAEFGEMRLVVVANFDDGIENSTRDLVRKIFDSHSVALYTLENLDPLLDDIKRSAANHPPGQASEIAARIPSTIPHG
jgi:hypothetical protein